MAGMESMPNWSAFVNMLIKLIPSAECIPNCSAFDDGDESFRSCKRGILSSMRVPEAICIGTRKEVSAHSKSCREQEGEDKLQLSKLQLEGENKLQLSKTQLNKMAQSQDENNLMFRKIHINSHLNKMAGMESVPDWSGLLTELLGEIAKKLSVIEDFMAFRGVCASWRAAVTKDKFVSVSKVPLLMLAEKDGDGNVREFYSLCKRKIFTRMPMPEVKEKRCIGAGFGWYLTVATSGGELNLVKPMSSAKIELPNMMAFLDLKKSSIIAEVFFIQQAVLSANPAETSDFLLMVGVNLNLGFWRYGDNHWTKIETKIPGQERTPCFADIGYYKHKMYAIDYNWRVWMWDPYLMSKEAEILLQLHVAWLRYMEPSLVESSKGDLLLIIRNRLHRLDPTPYKAFFRILKIDTVKKGYSQIYNLEGDAIFIGQNQGVSIAANDFPGVVKANCIYFTDTDWEQYIYTANGGGADMGIYSVEDERIERFDVESFSLICPPLWVFPSL